jgi:hypothetical protein
MATNLGIVPLLQGIRCFARSSYTNFCFGALVLVLEIAFGKNEMGEGQTSHFVVRSGLLIDLRRRRLFILFYIDISSILNARIPSPEIDCRDLHFCEALIGMFCHLVSSPGLARPACLELSHTHPRKHMRFGIELNISEWKHVVW